VIGQFSTVNEARAAITDAAARAAILAGRASPEPAIDDASFASKITTHEFSQRRRRGVA